jgi:glycosyltransferase involved in cell wall biosynthesis
MTGQRSFPGRVLMTADAVGGVWQYALELGRGLCGGGTAVVLAVMGPEPSMAQRAAAAAIDGLSLRHRPFRLEWMRGCERDLEDAARWLADLEDEFAPDIVHINGYAHAVGSWHAPVVVVCHSCVATWWRAVHGCAPPAGWDAYQRRVEQGLRAASLLVAPSRAFLESVLSTYDARTPSAVIHNGRGAPFGLQVPKEPMVISCGRAWDGGKGIDSLAGVAQHLPWPVYLAGETRSPEGGRSAPTSSILPLGRLDEETLAPWLARAAVFALPARYEPFGLSVLEAALSGCALVLGDIATLRELWDDAALFVHPWDQAALRAALGRLIDDEAFRRAMGARAVRRAQRYRPETTVAGYLRAYQAAGAEHGRRSRTAAAEGWA